MGDPLIWQVTTLRHGTQGWEGQESLMQSTARDLRNASASALPPSVQAAATTFLTRWAGYAEESTAIAQGFIGALRATADDYSSADDAADREFSDLDGRLGPSR
jgi:hypothetical protein